MKRVVAIIQARLGSSRLPLKSLLTLRGKPIIDWVTDRVSKAKKLSKVLVATTDTELDVILLDHLRNRTITALAGPENDVLARFVLAARAADADQIVRVCADNPFIWWQAIDDLIDFYQNGSFDYAYNHIPRDNLWPDGLGAEIISRELLEDINLKADKPGQREHCFNYIWDNAPNFKIGTYDPEPELQRPDIKLDVDKIEDFQRLASLQVDPSMDAQDIIQAYDKRFFSQSLK